MSTDNDKIRRGDAEEVADRAAHHAMRDGMTYEDGTCSVALAIRAIPAAQVRVTPLVREAGDGVSCSEECFQAADMFGGYYVVIERQWWHDSFGAVERAVDDNAAKAAAQADYEARIRAALDASAPADPVINAGSCESSEFKRGWDAAVAAAYDALRDKFAEEVTASRTKSAACYQDAGEIVRAAGGEACVSAHEQCCMCGKTGLSTIEGDGGLADGRRICSSECYDRAIETLDQHVNETPKPERETEGALLKRLGMDEGWLVGWFANAIMAGNDAAVTLTAALALPEIAAAVEALRWYGEQTRLCRLLHKGGDAGRHALNGDGGNRARAALAELEGKA